MNKAEIVERMSEKAGISKKDAEKALKAFTETITDELKKGEKVQILGFGTFETAERKERECRNPHTGQPMTVAKSTVPKFKAGKALKDAVQR